MEEKSSDDINKINCAHIKTIHKNVNANEKQKSRMLHACVIFARVQQYSVIIIIMIQERLLRSVCYYCCCVEIRL